MTTVVSESSSAGSQMCGTGAAKRSCHLSIYCLWPTRTEYCFGRMGYAGAWDIAVAGNGMRGASSLAAEDRSRLCFERRRSRTQRTHSGSWCTRQLGTSRIRPGSLWTVSLAAYFAPSPRRMRYANWLDDLRPLSSPNDVSTPVRWGGLKLARPRGVSTSDRRYGWSARPLGLSAR